MLELRGLHVAYGGIQAVRGIDLDVRQGEIVTLIGSNGAGKSSTLRAIVQLVRPRAGSITLGGSSLVGLATHDVVRRGVALVPEGRAIFGQQTVFENLLLGAATVRDQRAISERLERVFDLFPRLAERRTQQAGTLSGGEQQMLAIGRALLLGPQLLLLDEPSLGLSPKLVGQIFESIVRVAESGLTILLVEQNTRLALESSHRAYVLATGEVVLSGDSRELRQDPRVREAYLG
ncbi:MAG TPA: ABC transporter ATP-binding protein [Polyangiaceae bacterium]|nr:ABC transporter ATP-binding protein [Polyangiaceae bacterium]